MNSLVLHGKTNFVGTAMNQDQINAVDGLQSVVNALRLADFADVNKIESATQQLSDFRDTLNCRKNPKACKAVEYVANYIASLHDAAGEDEVSKDAISKFKGQASEKFDVVRADLSREPSGITQLQDASLEESTANASDEAELKKLSERITRYSKFKSVMPKGSSKTAKRVNLLRLPVVVILDPFATLLQLEAAGFSVDEIGQYPIIEDQLIVALHDKKLQEDDLEPDSYIKQVIEQIGKKKGGKWMLASESLIRWRQSGYIYYWVMESARLHSLIHARKNGSSSIEHWGLPF